MFEPLVFKYICMFHVSTTFFIIALRTYIMRDITILFGEVLIGDVISLKHSTQLYYTTLPHVDYRRPDSPACDPIRAVTHHVLGTEFPELLEFLGD